MILIGNTKYWTPDELIKDVPTVLPRSKEDGEYVCWYLPASWLF